MKQICHIYFAFVLPNNALELDQLNDKVEGIITIKILIVAFVGSKNYWIILMFSIYYSTKNFCKLRTIVRVFQIVGVKKIISKPKTLYIQTYTAIA